MTFFFSFNNISRKSETLIDWLYIPILFLIVVLLGNYGVFLGHTFIEGEPTYIRFHDFVGNMKSSGWRPDVGLGTTYFFGDPGTFHTWSLVRWWGHLFPSPLMGFNASIIVSLWIACFVQYMFLRKAVPGLEKIICFALATMIAFGPLRHAIFFGQSSMGLSPIVIPVIALLLHSFSKGPSVNHYFVYTLTLAASLFFGSSVSLMYSIYFSVAFFLLLTFYNGWYQSWKTLFVWLRRFFLLNLAAGISIIVLSAWMFYSIYLESQIIEYVRAVDLSPGPLFRLPDFGSFIANLLNYFSSGIFSIWTQSLGIRQLLGPHGMNSPFPIFSFILLVLLFFKTRNFWEYATKFLILGFVFYQEVVQLSPRLIFWMASIIKLKAPVYFSAVIHVFGILFTGIILSRLRSKEFLVRPIGVVLIKILASFLCLLYAGLFVISIGSIFFPDYLSAFFLNVWGAIDPLIASLSLKNMAPILISENVRLFHETMGFSSVIFYGITTVIAGLFMTRHGFIFMRWEKGIVFSLTLAISQVFLSWSIYSMNSEPLKWDRENFNGLKLEDMFSPTDRIMRVGLPSCKKSLDYYACVKDKFLIRDKGSRRSVFGHWGTPALELSSPRSVSQKEVSRFIDTLIRLEFPEMEFPEGINRSLQKDIPIYSSKLYDISGVKYVISEDPIPKNYRLKLIYSSRQFFLYEYLNSWPYFYLADRIQTINDFKKLYDAEKGVAYLWENEPKFPSLTISAGKKKDIKLKKFTFDSMEFTYSSEKSEFLVISDAWHPHWHATINNKELKIYKANGIFKGISLPPGQGTVKLYFDNSPYRPGIWVSVFGWVLFLGAWLFFALRTQQFKLINSNSMLR